MKKLVALPVVAALTLGLAACGGEPATENVALTNDTLLDDGFDEGNLTAIGGNAGDLNSTAPLEVDAGAVDANSAVVLDNGAATTNAF